MTPEGVLEIGRQALEMALILAGPILFFGLVAGLVISIFQALTQINEMTLVFIPKIAASALALLFFGPWMLQKMLGYTRALIESIPAVVQ